MIPTPAPAIRPGDRLSRYRVEREVGSGGMGVVYAAVDERLGRRVALKVLRAGSLTAPDARERFEREARALSRFQHPGITMVYDYDRQDSIDFLVLEYVEGETLEARIARGPIPLPEVLNGAVQVVGALAAAHEEAIIHGDLKPGNVMITSRGQWKLLDFGLARLCHAPCPTAETASADSIAPVAGTLAYMAPEQLLGEPVDARADLFAFGAVLYEMIAGRAPFRATLATALVNEVLHTNPGPPTRKEEPIPERLQELVSSLLQKSPDRRPGSAAWVLGELRGIARGDSHVAAPAARGAPVTRLASIAVLPLENLSSDPEQEFFVDGMTEALTTSLAQIRALRVASRTSALRYKGARRPLPEIARELGVDTILEGTVARYAGRVRITAQLIDGVADRHLWARSYERPMADVLALQGEVARAIASEVQVTLTPEDRARMGRERRVNPRAYESFLRGRHFWNRRTEADLRKAITHFEEAIALDADYAPAHAGVADGYYMLGTYGFLPPAIAFPVAEEAAQRALALDDSLAAARVSIAQVLFSHRWDWVGSETAIHRAISINPDEAQAHQFYADLLAAQGRAEESIASIRRAHELDPLSLIINVEVGVCYFYARRYEEAAEQQRRTLELDPRFPPAYRSLGGALEQLGHFDEAIKAYRRGIELSDVDTTATALLAHAYAVCGCAPDARRMLAELEAAGQGRYVSPYALAAIYVGLGEADRALERLERAYAMRDRGMIWTKVSPRLDPLREDPRFISLLKRMKLI